MIVNPRAGGGANANWSVAQRVLDDARFPYDVAVTDAPGRATELARRAVDSGHTFIVAVGGDGTVNEVVNGMMGEDRSARDDLVLGVLPGGSGCDFGRTFGLPSDPAAAARVLLDDAPAARVDVAQLTYRDRRGGIASRWFANIAQAGLGAEAVAIASKLKRRIGSGGYAAAAVRALERHTPRRVRISMRGRPARDDAPIGEISREAVATMLVLANGVYYGGGLRVAPLARPDDGLLDVLLFHGPKDDALRIAPLMPGGEHVTDDSIAEYIASEIEAETDEPVAVEADGELLGTTPISARVVRDALAVKR